jgi:hypothetical protein
MSILGRTFFLAVIALVVSFAAASPASAVEVTHLRGHCDLEGTIDTVDPDGNTPRVRVELILTGIGTIESDRDVTRSVAEVTTTVVRTREAEVAGQIDFDEVSTWDILSAELQQNGSTTITFR